MVVILRTCLTFLLLLFIILCACSSDSSETVVPVETTQPAPDYYEISSITMDNASPLTPLWAQDYENLTNVSPAIAFRWPMTIERKLISGSAGYAIDSDQLVGSLTIIGFNNQTDAISALDAMKSMALDSLLSEPLHISSNGIEVDLFASDEDCVILFQLNETIYAVASAPLTEDIAIQLCEEIIQNEALMQMVLESIDSN